MFVFECVEEIVMFFGPHESDSEQYFSFVLLVLLH